MISDEEYAAWLRDTNARRIWLIELDWSGGTEYLQYGDYTQPGDTVWRSCVEEIVWSDRLDGQTPVDSIRLINAGEFDDWLGRDWLGQPVRLLIGDARWPRSAFRQRAVLVNGGIRSATDSALELAIHNPLVALDAPVQPVVDDRTPPVAFGAPFNVTPVLVDTNLGYQAHSGAVAISAVRDKGGAPDSITPGDPVGGFRLDQQPVGGVTCDPVAPAGTAAELVTALCADTGITPSAASLAALPDWPLGIYCNSGETRRAVLDQLLVALLAAPVMNAANELEIRLQRPPSVTASVDLTGEVGDGSFEITGFDAPRGRVTVNYGRNWTVQDGNALLAGDLAITPEQRQRYGQQYLSISQQLHSNPLLTPLEINTPFTEESAAQAVLARVSELRSQQRYRARLMIPPVLAQSLRPGDTVRLQHPRYGLQDGVNMRVLSVELSGEIEVFW